MTGRQEIMRRELIKQGAITIKGHRPRFMPNGGFAEGVPEELKNNGYLFHGYPTGRTPEGERTYLGFKP